MREKPDTYEDEVVFKHVHDRRLVLQTRREEDIEAVEFQILRHVWKHLA
jgi:hypothetical protein